jgi:hypothetical protein
MIFLKIYEPDEVGSTENDLLSVIEAATVRL